MSSTLLSVNYIHVCHKQYVGETQNPLHIRLNGHRNNIKHKPLEQPVAAALIIHTLILPSWFQNRCIAKMMSCAKEESFWIHQLHSLHPAGMNLDPLLFPLFFTCMYMYFCFFIFIFFLFSYICTFLYLQSTLLSPPCSPFLFQLRLSGKLHSYVLFGIVILCTVCRFSTP